MRLNADRRWLKIEIIDEDKTPFIRMKKKKYILILIISNVPSMDCLKIKFVSSTGWIHCYVIENHPRIPTTKSGKIRFFYIRI